MAKTYSIADTESPDNWQAQSDGSTLISAQAIKTDPQRHAAALLHLKQKKAQIAAVTRTRRGDITNLMHGYTKK